MYAMLGVQVGEGHQDPHQALLDPAAVKAATRAADLVHWWAPLLASPHRFPSEQVPW